MSIAIVGLGTAVPDATLDQAEALKVAETLCCRTPEQATWVPGMYAGTGIQKRHICLGRAVVRDILDGTKLSGSPFLPTGEDDDRGPTTQERMAIYAKESTPLAIEASTAALSAAGVKPTEITHVVTVSCTGFSAPGFDIGLINGLGLSPDVARTHVGFMGCHGALNGLRVANAFAAQPRSTVLLCSVELSSLHYHYGWDPQRVVANALFADGAGAMVGVAEPRADRKAWRLRDSATHLVPSAASAMTWTIDDWGFTMTLSKKIPDTVSAHLRPWVESWLSKHGLRIGDIGTWAVHPGGPKVLDAVGEALGLPATSFGPSREVLAQHGNMSSATIVFILRRAIEAGAARPCVALGFGPGLTMEGALFV